MSIQNTVYIENLLDVLPGSNANIVTKQKGSLVSHDSNKTIEFLSSNVTGNMLFVDNSTSSGLIWRQGTPSDVQLGNVANQLNNFNAVTNPTVNDGSNLGYSIGSRWINTLTDTVYTAVDVTPGSAIWVVSGGSSPSVIAGAGLFYSPSTTLNVGDSTTILVNADNVAVKSSAVSGQFLKSAGSTALEAVWGTVNLADTTNVTGTLNVTQGGTGATSFTPNKIISANGSGNALTSSLFTLPVSDGTSGQVLSTNGAGQLVFANSPIVTNATTTTTTSTPTTITSVTIPLNSTVYITAKFSAKATLASLGASFELKVSVSNFGGTLQFNAPVPASPASIQSFKALGNTWTVQVGAFSLSTLPIQVVGDGNTVNWIVQVSLLTV